MFLSRFWGLTQAGVVSTTFLQSFASSSALMVDLLKELKPIKAAAAAAPTRRARPSPRARPPRAAARRAHTRTCRRTTQLRYVCASHVASQLHCGMGASDSVGARFSLVSSCGREGTGCACSDGLEVEDDGGMVDMK